MTQKNSKSCLNYWWQ